MRAALIALFVCAPAFAAPLVPLPAQPADVPWPTHDWPTGDLPSSAVAALEPLLGVVGQTSPSLGETRAVVIIHHGRLVTERYAPGYSATTRLISWSMAKSITHALLGIAVRDHLVDPDRPMGNPRWKPDDPRAAIPWRQWEQMVDGQEYHEIGVVNPARNDAARMLYGEGRLDVAAFAASLPLIHAPGTHWNYNSAGVNLVCDALGRAFAPGAGPDPRRQRVADVLSRELFGPLGMTSATPEFDAQGTFIGSALVYATARDYARFGLLYLRDGVWDGKRILPTGWVDFARTRGPAPNSGLYGAGFWITPEPGDSQYAHALCPHGPRDLFNAQGHEGQLIVIVPSKDLVLVRLGLLDDRHFHALGAWAEQVVALFPDVVR
jgi:CubicO group peptidase (beta-lactamase class C family)